MKKRPEDLKEASGSVTYSDPLTTFFYLLMRNELAAGKVEELVREVVDSPNECTFTNGWLANYANNLSEEVKNARVIQLQKALDQAFTDANEEAKAKEKQSDEEKLKNAVQNTVIDSLGDEELQKLEQKIIKATEEGTLTPVDKEVDPGTSAAEAKDVLQRCVAQGIFTQEQADGLSDDIDEAAKTVAEEVVVEIRDEDKVTTEEAKEIVDHAVELSGAIEDLVADKPVETFEEQAVRVVSDQAAEDIYKTEDARLVEDLELIKNGEVVSDEDWKSKHVTKVNITNEVTADEVEKWKNTNKELQNQEKDETTTEEE